MMCPAPAECENRKRVVAAKWKLIASQGVANCCSIRQKFGALKLCLSHDELDCSQCGASYRAWLTGGRMPGTAASDDSPAFDL
jgi:hypothetical protein